MARLISLGKPATQGEKKTLAYLRDHLPSHWVILGNPQVGNQRVHREIDVIVIGDRCVWVVDEKGFGGSITGDEHEWRLADGAIRERVLFNVQMAAKIVSPMVSRGGPGSLWVEPVIILSADDADFRVVDPSVSRYVVKLAGCENYFLKDAAKYVKLLDSPLTSGQITEIQTRFTGKRILERLEDRIDHVGPFEFVEKRSANGYARTFLSRHKETGEFAEVKLYDLTDLPDDRSREDARRFVERQFEALKRLRDTDGIVRIVASFQPIEGYVGELYYIALDIPSGPSVRKRIRDNAWGVESRVAIAKLMCELVQNIHQEGVIHRGLNPGCIYFDSKTGIRLGGFEFSRLPQPVPTLPVSASDIPHDAYIAPEVTGSFENTSRASDVYSLGVILHEIFARRKPFGQSSRAIHDADPILGQSDTGLPEQFRRSLESTIQQMLPFQAESRLTDLSEVIGILNSYSEDGNRKEPQPLKSHTPHEEPLGLQEGIYPGALLKNRYLVERELGKGGIGVVYLARDQQLLLRPVVIKVLQESWSDDTWIKNKFNQEIESLSRIDHPGVVGVVDYGDLANGQPFIVMQYIEGNSLEAELKKSGSFTLDRTANLIRQMCLALNAAHCKGVIHRDLKPQNIMIQHFDGEEVVKIIDFGIAKVKDSKLATSTKESITAGTLLYMAPEQIKNSQCSVASDIWSLGVIAYEMLTGDKPFVAHSEVDLFEMQRAGLQRKPSALRSDLPLDAEKAIDRVLSFDPAARPSKASQFADEFSAAVSGKTRSPEFDSTPTRKVVTDVVQPKVVPIPEGAKPVEPSLFRSVSPKRLVFSFTIVLIFTGIVWILAGSNLSDQTTRTSPSHHKAPAVTATIDKAIRESSNNQSNNKNTVTHAINPDFTKAQLETQFITDPPNQKEPKGSSEPEWIRELPPNGPNIIVLGVAVVRSDGSADLATELNIAHALSSKATVERLGPGFFTSEGFGAAFEENLSPDVIQTLGRHLDFLLVVSKITEFSQPTTNITKANTTLEYRLIDAKSGKVVLTSNISQLGPGYTEKEADQKATQKAVAALADQISF